MVNHINKSNVAHVDSIKFKTVKTVSNSGYHSVNTGINPGDNEKIFYKFNRFNGFPKLAVNLSNIIYLSLFLIIFTSCKEDTITPEMFGSISGVVLDADDSSPIAGASVTTSPPTNALVTDK